MDTVVTTAFAQKSAKIDELVDIEQARFAVARPKSRSFWAEGRKNYLYGGPSHWMRRWAGGFPIYVDHARGAELTDIDGNTYTDFCLGDTGGMCGHAHEAITEAALTQLGRGTTTMLPTEDANWVGQELERRFGLPFWTLTTSATDANRGAIRLSRMVTGRNKVLVFSGCYHGGVEEAHVEIRDGTIGLRNGIHPNGVDHSRVSKVVEFNDRDAVRAALADKDVACVLMEPMMTNFGMIPVAAGFNEFVREETRRTGTVLIIDETHTLSSGPGGFTAAHGLDPDVLVAGKAIAGGIPAGVFGVSEDIARRVWDEVPYVNPRKRQSAHLGIGGTLAGNALTVATMKAVLSSILIPENYALMIENAERLAVGTRAIIEREGLPWHVSQVGARAEIMFSPEPPRNGADVIFTRRGDLEVLLHAFYMNEGILVTPFHTMFLMCPATRADQVDHHASVFGKFARLVKEAGVD